jgi:fructose-1,6-bisphosphatase/inositol monophosphatase family enzyme
MTATLIENVSDLIAEVAERAILPRFRRLKDGDIDEKTPGELVTVADREAEVMLKFYRDVGFTQNKTGFQIRQIPVRGA